MAPRADDNYADSVRSVANCDLIPDAGKIVMEEGRLWGSGIIGDFKQTVGTHWVSEMTNFNQKTVGVGLLMFITVISPALSFGAVYGKVTENNIGAIETILATAWIGVAFSLLGGMPVVITGSTGPVLAYTTVVFNMSKNLDIPFLPFNAWISIWLFIYAVVCAIFDGTRIVKMCTRFTDEVFALLIVSIFVMDAVGDPFSQVGILRYFDPNHPSRATFEKEHGDDYSFMETALLSTILGFGTTYLIFWFRGFKTSPFFPSQGIRTSIHDFAVSASVVIMTVIKVQLFPSIFTEGLKVPSKFEPSFACCDSSCKTFFPDDCEGQAEAAGTRSWFVNMGDLNGKGWVPFMAAGPAFLAFFLVYLDNGITWHLVHHPSNRLMHGDSYNYEICLSGIFNMINGLMGMPWLVASTVPCMVHLNNLAERDRDNKIISVQETRLTNLIAHSMVGLTTLFLDTLKLLPLPVLYGVFFFFFLSSIVGLQFFHRVCMFFMESSKYPDTAYTRYMEKSRIHKYTLYQLVFFGLIFLVQNFKALSIVFPMMTMLLIPARLYGMPMFLENWECVLLDGDEDEIAEWIEAKERSLGNKVKGKGDVEADEEDSESNENEEENV